MTEIVRAHLGAGALVEAGRGETRVQLCLTQRALVAGRADTLEPVVEGDTDPVMLTRHGETVVHQESVQHQTVLNINISLQHIIHSYTPRISVVQGIKAPKSPY